MAILDEMLRRTVVLKVSELPMTPARALGIALGNIEGADSAKIRNWRCNLSRKGQTPKTAKETSRPTALSITILSPTEPTLTMVLECLAADIEASKLTLWDFGTTYANGRTDAPVLNMHHTCKRVAPRVLKFFGDLWPKIAKVLS